MKWHGTWAVVTSLMLSASIAAAQDTNPAYPHPGRNDTGRPGPSMMIMDSLNRRLDSLVGRMNRAAGNQKITAMAEVINELVTQRKAMQQHMRGMMDRHGMPMMGPEAKAKTPPEAKPGVGPDTGHAEHR